MNVCKDTGAWKFRQTVFGKRTSKNFKTKDEADAYAKREKEINFVCMDVIYGMMAKIVPTES